MEDLKNLVTRVQSGDWMAYGIIMQRFQDMAVGYGYAILGDLQLAEDAAQEAFINAYCNLSDLRDPAAFPGWFRQIVLTQINRLRRGKQALIVSLSYIPEVTSLDPGPVEVVEKLEVQQVISGAIGTLPEHQRLVMTLFYISEYSQKEISLFLGIPVATVKTRLHAARKRLKERIITMAQDYLQENRPSKDNMFVDKVLDIITPKKKAHREEIYGLLEVGELPGNSQWRQGRIAHSHLDWKTSRIGLVDGRVITVVGVYDISMRIGSAQVRTAGINLDATHVDYRDYEETIMEKVTLTVIEAMRTQGYDLSVTFGNEAFFYRLGYTFGWRELAWSVKTDDLPSDPLDFELHEFTPKHREDLTEIYNQENERLTGTAVKPTYLRDKHPGLFRGWYWTDARGKPVGYISGDAAEFSMDLKFQSDLDRGRITEVIRQRLKQGGQYRTILLSQHAVCVVQEEGSRWLILDGQQKYLILKDSDKLNVFGGENSYFWVDESAGDPKQRLQVLGWLTHQSGCEGIFFDRLHYKSALGKHLRQLRSCKIELGGYRESRSYVVRIINLQALFENLAPELSRRLSKSPLVNWKGNLVIANTEEEVMLAIDSSKIQVVESEGSEHSIRGGSEIAQLIVGTEAPSEIIEMANIQLTGNANQLVEILFPAQYPQMENQAL